MSVVIRIAKSEIAENIGALGLSVWIDTYAIAGVEYALSSMAIEDFHK